MVKSYAPIVSEIYDYDAFYAALDRISHDFLSDEFLTAAAEELARLNNNKSLIFERFVEAGGWDGVRQSFQSTQSIILENRQTRFGRIALRCNFWFPIANSKFYQLERNIYAYELCHNHNFRFMTIGHFGGGYVTDIGAVDPDRLTAELDQPVEISDRRTERLERGKILYFEPFSDIHIQHPSQDISISLNLILGSSEWEREQYEFDLDRSLKLGDVPQGSVDRVISSIDFIKFFPSAKAEAVLREMSHTAPFERIRSAAAAAADEVAQELARVTASEPIPMETIAA